MAIPNQSTDKIIIRHNIYSIDWMAGRTYTVRSPQVKEVTMTNHRLPIRMICALALPAILAGPVAAHEVPDPSIIHNARDGVVRLYGAGGPDTAFKKVADVFTKETGIKVVITGGPEPTWTKEAQADADILWGTAEEDITALLETYKDFTWDDVWPHQRANWRTKSRMCAISISVACGHDGIRCSAARPPIICLAICSTA
jgi:hypothetical protein